MAFLKLQDAYEKRNKAIATAREITDREGERLAKGEIREIPAEVKEQVDAALADADTWDDFIEKLEKIESKESDSSNDEVEDRDDEDKDKDMNSRRNRVDRGNKRFRPFGLDGESRSSVVASKEYRKAFDHYCRTGDKSEYRDVILGTNSQGGYLATPTQISDYVIMLMNNLVYMRELCGVTTVNSAKSLGVRQILTNPANADWTTEIGSVVTDSSMTFGRRDLTPQPLTKQVKVSLQELEVVEDVAQLIADRLTYVLQISQENGFMNGSGSGQPLGVFTASASGIPTSQDYVVTANSSTVLLADKLVSARFQIPQQYLNGPKVRWIFHRARVNDIRLLKDTTNRYLFQPAVGGSFEKIADTFDGIPILYSEYAPSTAISQGYVGLLGNFDYYKIAELKGFSILRLNELYQQTNEIGFLARLFLDAAPVLPNAFVRLQYA